jgi:hypothetical protein
MDTHADITPDLMFADDVDYCAELGAIRRDGSGATGSLLRSGFLDPLQRGTPLGTE